MNDRNEERRPPEQKVPWTMPAMAAVLVIIIVAYIVEWGRRLFGS